MPQTVAQPVPARSGQRAVLLVHETPDGSAHIDWMIERPAPLPDARSPEHTLQTFRVVCRVDTPPDRPFLAFPIADHRAAYLSTEGELGRSPESRGRGTVRRIAEGDVAERTPRTIDIAWATGRLVRYELAEPQNGIFLVSPTPVSAGR